jgi:phosphatidylserine/phosphatidylglycerophosphate/cardiolipin synthase-like enzyme
VRFKNTDAINVYRGIFNADWNYCEIDDGKSWECAGFTISKNYHMRDDLYGEGMTLMPTISPVKFDHINADADIEQIINILNSSNNEILLQFLTYNSNTKDVHWFELDSALIRAALRGVKVKLIVSDWSIGKGPDESLKRLANISNIEVKYSAIPEFSGGYISFARVEHCKYIVADSNCWIGTANAEKSYFYNTRNVGVVVINNKTFSDRVRDIFYLDWNGPYTHYIKSGEDYIPREHGEK